MEQLIKVSSVPFQAIRFTQNARLVPADNMALERHKALVRHHAFLSRFRAASGCVDYDFLNQVNAAFSKETRPARPRRPFQGCPRLVCLLRAGTRPVRCPGQSRENSQLRSARSLFPARPLPPLLLLIHPYPAIRTRRSMHLLSRFRQKPLPLT